MSALVDWVGCVGVSGCGNLEGAQPKRVQAEERHGNQLVVGVENIRYQYIAGRHEQRCRESAPSGTEAAAMVDQ